MTARQLRKTAAAAAVSVWLGFTPEGSLRAEPARPPDSGLMIRTGSQVGTIELGADALSAIGAMVAIGGRVGRLSVEAEYSVLGLHDPGDVTTRLHGRMRRLGVTGRVVVLSHAAGSSSILRYWVEGGVGRLHAVWDGGEQPDRTELCAGGGLLLDHGVGRVLPRSPMAVGWLFGWRVGGAPRGVGPSLAACRGPCPQPTARRHDLAVTLTSSLLVTW
jgi:hypothetical protein